ncbi:MAG: ABC transporter permease subunit [Bacillota bacterium]|jgi:ABC-2 type transport system permease protein
MSWTLFKANIRNTRAIWIIMTAIFCLYFVMVTWMYDPEGAETLQEMLQMLPEALINAFGFSDMGASLTSFIANYMYGFLVFLFPMVISIVVNHKLLAAHIDKGSMAYLLATPNSRLKIAKTQLSFSLASITLFFVLITIVGTLVCQAAFPGALDIGKFIQLNLYALVTYYAIGGIGFFASCIANESKHSLGIGVGLPVAFLALQMLGDVGEKFSWVGNLSLYALFDPNKLLEGSSFAYVGMAVLAAIAIALYSAGVAYFNRRDLHV